MEGYSVYFSVGCLAVIVMYVQCGHLCPVLLSVLSVLILEKSMVEAEVFWRFGMK